MSHDPPIDEPSAKSLIAGRYQLKSFLGEGGAQRVYHAHDAGLARDVVLTLIQTDDLGGARVSRIRREAEAIGRLGGHPHIVALHDIGEEGGDLYFTTAYTDCDSLAVHLAKRESHRLPTSEALRIAEQICQALVHAHGHEIVHRDLSPANIWIGADGTARLAGFGSFIALDNFRLARPDSAAGSAAYVSPEQALGRETDERSDLYSLGAVMYEMVTGRPPFQADDFLGVISQHINTSPVVPSWHNADTPSAFENLIVQLLDKEPERRPKSAALVREVLLAISSEIPPVVKQGAVRKVNLLDRLAAGVFVGRSQEMAILMNHLDDALSSKGQLLLIYGEPGVGKTRITEELATYARLRKAKVFTARSYEGEDASAFRPLGQIIRSYVRGADPSRLKSDLGEGAAEIAKLVPDERDRVWGLPAPPLPEHEQGRYRLFKSISHLLKNVGEHEPLVLIFDDLHWADKQTLAYLQFLAEEISGMRLLVIGTYRDVEVCEEHPLRLVLDVLAQENLGRRMSLCGLSDRSVARFIEITTALAPSEGLVDAVYKGTGGNPLFVNEVIRLLVEEGRLESAEKMHSWGFAIPPEVRVVIDRRIQHLTRECKEVLSIAALIGQEFDIGILRRAIGLSSSEVTRCIQEARAARLLLQLPWPLSRYRFSHALVSEVLYTELPSSRRADLHQRVGEVLEAANGGPGEERFDNLAHHFFKAVESGALGAVDEAIDYCQRAGDRAAALFAYGDAAGHYRHALQALSKKDHVEEKRRCELLLALGEALAKGGDKQRGRETLLQAGAVARKLGAADDLARAALGLNQTWAEVGKTDEDWVALLEEAMAALGSKDCARRVRILAGLAVQLHYSDCFEKRQALSKEAVEVARRLGDPVSIACALHARHIAIWAPDNAEERLALATEIVRLAEGAGAIELALVAHHWRQVAFLEMGDRAAADAELEILDRYAETLRQPYYRWGVALSRTMRALLEGRFDETEKLAEQALRLGERVEPVNARQAYAAHFFRMRASQGRFSEFESAFRGFLDQAPEFPAWRAGLALVLCELGRPEEARAEFEVLAAKNFADLRYDDTFIITLSNLSMVAYKLGDVRRAARLYGLLLPFAHLYVMSQGIIFNGPVSFYLGILATTMRQWKEAAQRFEYALRMNHKMGARPWLARTQHEYADMLFHRGEPGDREKAWDLVCCALTTFQELGMKGLLEKALALKLEIQCVAAAGTQRWMTDAVGTVARDKPSSAGSRAAGEISKEPPVSREAALFRGEGEYWIIGYDGIVSRLKDNVGLRYIGELLRYPGREFLSADLVAAVHIRQPEAAEKGTGQRRRARLRAAGLRRGGLGDAGEILDPKAKHDYKHRLRELQEELREAKAFNDLDRASRVQAETDLLTEELAKAVGLRGRDRRAASPAERARVNATMAIRRAIRKIARHNPALERHLAAAVKTGRFCSYSPQPGHSVAWTF